MAPASDWKEIIPADEAARFERHAATLGALQKKNAKGGDLGRALHVKGNIGVEAELEVLPDLPAEARQAMFATPQSYRAVVRFSNGAARHQSDRKMDVRGIAVKVFGVAGKKLIPGMEDAKTQDFLAIRTSSVPMRDADEFMTLVRAAATPALLPFKLIGGLGFSRGLGLMKAAITGLKAPATALAATTWYSALPIKYGPYAVQYAFVPHDPPAPFRIREATHLGDDLAARLRDKPVVYDLKIRFYESPTTTPIEDASVEWKTELVTIARLTLPVQDPSSPRGRKVAALVEQLAFDPWHALEDLRPLGNIMRARNHAYRVSTQARAAVPEPFEPPTFE